MEQSQTSHFRAITRLKLIDVKSQKKTIPFKKFCNLPLSQQQQLKQKYQQSQWLLSFEEGRNSGKQSRQKFYLTKSLNKLSKPRIQRIMLSQNSEKINKILRKCKKLMSHGNKFKTEMSSFEKHSVLCLDSIQKRMKNLISDGLATNYYI